jgi:hypothetical protein
MTVYLFMATIIKVNKATSRQQLDEALAKLPKRKKVDLNKYVGKINFGLDYQLKSRNE